MADVVQKDSGEECQLGSLLELAGAKQILRWLAGKKGIIGTYGVFLFGERLGGPQPLELLAACNFCKMNRPPSPSTCVYFSYLI